MTTRRREETPEPEPTRVRAKGGTSSEEMTTQERRALRMPRVAGPLEVSREVHSALVRILVTERAMARADGEQASIDPAPSLSLEAVDALEDHLRARLPDDALAIFAASTDTLDGFALGRVGALTELAWERGLSKARVVLGEMGPRLVCIPRRPDRGFALRVTFFDVEERTEGDSSTIAAWLERALEESVDDAVEEEDVWEQIEREAARTPWSPRLDPTLAKPAADEGPRRRVRHARFGEGVVVRALPEGDKLEIDFGEAGLKVLVAKYVEELGE